jgi:hypothetical protein
MLFFDYFYICVFKSNRIKKINLKTETMKKLFTLTGILIPLFFLQVSAQNDIPNKDFEQWDDFITYEDPTYWDTPNAETGLVNIFEVTRDTIDVYQGLYSARLETKNVLSIAIVPGILTLGDFTANFVTHEFSVAGGTPFSVRPTKLTGQYQYAPQGGDACVFAIALTKFNEATSQHDTIGGGSLTVTTATTDWTAFEVPVYYLSEEIPDTMNIVIFSSPPVGAVAGSVLLVDALDLDFGVGIDDPSFSRNIRLFMDPARDQLLIQFNFESKKDVSLKVYNVCGQVLFSDQQKVANNQQTINMENYPDGLYMVEIISGNERLVEKILK